MFESEQLQWPGFTLRTKDQGALHWVPRVSGTDSITFSRSCAVHIGRNFLPPSLLLTAGDQNPRPIQCNLGPKRRYFKHLTVFAQRSRVTETGRRQNHRTQ